MIKYLNKKNTHDSLHQFQWVHPLQKTKLIQSSITTANNRLIKQPKLINPLYLFLTLFLGQKPKINVSKRSIAAFKIRPNIPLGTKNHLHKSSLTLFYSTFVTTLLPVLNQSNSNVTFAKNNKDYTILLSYGWKDMNNPIVSSGDYLLTYPFLDGAHVQWTFKSPVNHLPFYYFKYSSSSVGRATNR